MQPKRGDLVYLNVPTATPKLRYQWTQPVWLVLRTSVTTVTLKPVVSAAGRKHKQPPLKVINRKKVRVAGPRLSDFWMGAIVRSKFDNTWFLGSIYDMVTDEGKTFFKVQYRDGDHEEMDQGEVWDRVIYHPRMDEARYSPAELPLLNEMVLFSDGQQPKIGQVTAIDEEENLPVTVRLWKPSSKAKSLAAARFTQALDDENLTRLRPEQILLNNLNINTEGHLTADGQQRVRKLLRKPRAEAAPEVPPCNNAKDRAQPRDAGKRASTKDNEATAETQTNLEDPAPQSPTQTKSPVRKGHGSRVRRTRRTTRYNLRSR